MELDYEQYKLVKEALHERRIFLQTAPYLSAMLPIMLPIYKYVISLPFDPFLLLCRSRYQSMLKIVQILASSVLLVRLQDVRYPSGRGEYGVFISDEQGKGPRSLSDAETGWARWRTGILRRYVPRLPCHGEDFANSWLNLLQDNITTRE